MFDRKKDMINRGGYKIYSVEVENALMSFAGVVEAAVVAQPCPVLGERVHAFVVAAPGVQPADLQASLRQAARRLQGAGRHHAARQAAAAQRQRQAHEARAALTRSLRARTYCVGRVARFRAVR